EVGALAQELERVGRDTKRQITMERRNRVKAARTREPHRLFSCRLKVAPELDQFGAVRSHGRVFLGRIALRQDDRPLEPCAPPSEGKPLAVIAARRRNDPANRGVALGERVDISKAATHLEGAGWQ